MPMLSLSDARDRVIQLVKANEKLAWASSLPRMSIDEEAWAYTQNVETAPASLIQRCNPFDVLGQLSDLSALSELVGNLRSEAQALEGKLLQEVLSDDRSQRTTAARSTIASTAHDADKAQAGQQDEGGDLDPISTLFSLEGEALDQRYAFRGEEGHPWNIMERIVLLRKRYCADLARLLAKAEAVTFVLKDSFGLPRPGSLLMMLRPNKNPLQLVEGWLRDVSIEMEAQVTRERILTVYGYAVGMQWASNYAGVSSALAQGDPVSFDIQLAPELFRIVGGEKGRIQAIGLAPVFDYSWPYPKSGDATALGSWYSELRALQRRVSFSGSMTFPAAEYIDPAGKRFIFPPATETFAGVAGWGAASGALSEHVIMQSSRRLANRPVSGVVKVGLDADTYHPPKKSIRTAIPQSGTYPEVTVIDLVIALRVAITTP